MNIIQDYIPAGRKNRPGRSNPMKYITVHNTGNSSKGAGAKNHASYIKSDAASSTPASWHYTVDETAVYQHLPDNETAYHAGDGANGTGNAQSIGIEICMNSDGDIRTATDNAAELAANLCKKYNIPVEKVVQHNRWTGKGCPTMIRAGKPYDWNTFINKVKLKFDVTIPAPTATQTAQNQTTSVNTADMVSIKAGAVYGGLSSARGKAVPHWVIDGRKYTVSNVSVHHGEREALLKEINSWIAVKHLICVV